MIEIRRFGYADTDLFNLARKIRSEVFIIEQQVPEELEYENEEESHHYLLLMDGEPAATARWRETPCGIKLERFAVPLTSRNLGLGTLLLKRVMEDVLPLGKHIYLHAQVAAANYYQKAGFVREGDVFEEAGIHHYKMSYPDSVQ